MIYAKIKEALMELKDEVTVGTVRNNTYGICYNLDLKLSVKFSLSHNAYSFVSNNCDDWEFYSGNSSYPVNEPDTYTKGCYWKGEQLELRLSLIDHLIKKCDEQL